MKRDALYHTKAPVGGPTCCAGRRPIRRDLRASLADGAAFSVMVGAGETFVPAFALALGMGEVLAGLVSTIPMLAGAVLQLASPWAVARLGSHRRWVVICAVCQALSLLLLPICVLINGRSAWLLFAATTLYWAAGLATGPAWNAWVETLVPRRIRATFFATRTWVCQFGALAGFVVGGLVLQAGSMTDRAAAAFSLLFVAAAICRFISAGFLSRHSEPRRRTPLDSLEPGGAEHVGLVEVVKRLRGHAGARLLVSLLAMQTSVWIAAPFFTPYMLAHLGFSYWQFVTLTAAAFVARILVMPLLGRLAQRDGAHRLLWLGALGVIPLSALWLVSNSLVYLSALQFFAGIAWAAYELAMFLMFFETIPRHERIGLLTLYNLGNSVAMVVGSILGAALLKWQGEATFSYLMLFAVSSIARAATLLLLARVPRIEFESVNPGVRTLAVRPSAGAITAPILPSIPNGERESQESRVQSLEPEERYRASA